MASSHVGLAVVGDWEAEEGKGQNILSASGSVSGRAVPPWGCGSCQVDLLGFQYQLVNPAPALAPFWLHLPLWILQPKCGSGFCCAALPSSGTSYFLALQLTTYMTSSPIFLFEYSTFLLSWLDFNWCMVLGVPENLSLLLESVCLYLWGIKLISEWFFLFTYIHSPSK